jgi:hypothetical protein
VWKGEILGLQFLQAGHVRHLGLQPGQKVRQAAIDVVDVECGDFQWRSIFQRGQRMEGCSRPMVPFRPVAGGHPYRFVRRSLRSVRTAFKAASTSLRSADAAICQYASLVAPPAIDLAMSAISRLHDPRIDVAIVIASDLSSSTD